MNGIKRRKKYTNIVKSKINNKMSSDVEQIKERLNIIDVISSYLKVEKAGINFKAKCPFHNEKTPSFFISPTRQSFYCFGCGEKGDIFSFVEKFENLDFRGALETLANKAGIKLKGFKSGERSNEKDELFEIMGKATKIYEKNLAENKKELEYLRKRGLSETSISKWRLGFAEDGWRNLYNHLTKDGFTKEKLLEAGLIKRPVLAAVSNESGFLHSKSTTPETECYDTFRNRIMFPIFDVADRVIAFSGRALKEDDKTPKYLNSPETKLFYKSEVLYGFNVAKNYIRKLDYAVLVEGQIDLIMSHQVGVLNTVASSGTALTELHLNKIQKLSNRVIIAYDSDLAGEKASRRAAELALLEGMEAKVTSLPKGEDPASIIAKKPQKWKQSLKESEHFLDFALNKTLKESNERNLVKEIFKNVLPLIPLIGSDMEKSRFVKKVALKMRVSEEDVWSDIKKTAKVGRIGSEDAFLRYSKSPALSTGQWQNRLERIIIGIIFLEESKKRQNKKYSKYLKERWGEIAGKNEIEKMLDDQNNNKEALIFEAEEFDMMGDTQKNLEDVLGRIELEKLKQKLQKTTAILDDENISKNEEMKTRENLKKIQKRVKELSS